MIFTSNFLPCIAYMSAFVKFDDVSVTYDEYYEKQTYRNRAYVLGANKVETLSIPVHKIANKTLLKDIKIDNHELWQRRFWRTIEAAYKKSPFFEHYDYLFYDLFHKKYDFLYDLNHDSLSKCLKSLKVNKTICLVEKVDFENKNEIFSFNAKKRGENPDFFKPVPYLQNFGNGFVSNLSIIDLIFCKGPESLQILNNSIRN